jgi:putative tryptophan/tyrosine transport system ATP-binding protein
MINITNLDKIFNRGKVNQVTALQNINLIINKGEFLVVVGANGSGKSTLLNAIAGSIFPSAGEVRIDGIDVSSFPEYKRSKWIARVFQNPLSGTAPDLSILDNFRLAALRTSKKKIKIGITEKFRNEVRGRLSMLGMGLENKIDQPMGTLSGGQRQALTLLMGVMDKCEILLLDEPTAALDPRSAELVMETANKLVQDFNLTAILITHNLREAFSYGNRIIQMGEGRVIRDLNKLHKQQIRQADIYEWFL